MTAQEVALGRGPHADPTCATVPLQGGLSRDEAEAAAALLKAVADPVRLRIVSLIGAEPALEACVCELTPVLGLAQPTVSHHLKVLVDAGVLEREKRGTWAWFRLVPGRLAEIAAAVSPATAGAAGSPR
jgi:ArsR family transcriptional regulator